MADEINNIQPGIDIEPEQKKKLAADNLKASEEAHKQAAAKRTQDIADGRGMPPEQTIANIIKKNLEQRGGEDALQQPEPPQNG